MYNGIINIYKERGYTSHDVVAKLRGILGQRKIGHTGTLDPDAEGVLPVCLGSGTKLCDMLTDRDKVYEAGLLLGVTTDTLDITGTVTGEIDWDAFEREESWRSGKTAQAAEEQDKSETESHPGTNQIPKPVAEVNLDRNVKTVTEKNQKKSLKLEERICEVLSSFVGKQMQIPPMYSALKINGKKLVDLARTGVVLERKPREIEIYSIEVLSMDLPHIRLLVHCSKGTYIRSLCDDIGRELGCGGCMETLIRRAVGPFRLEDAKTLGEITEIRDCGELERCIIPPDEMFDYPRVRVDTSYLVPAQNGNLIPAGKLAWGDQAEKLVWENQAENLALENQAAELAWETPAEKPNSYLLLECMRQSLRKDPAENERLRIYLPDGKFLGIYRWNSEKAGYVPEKIFLSR